MPPNPPEIDVRAGCSAISAVLMQEAVRNAIAAELPGLIDTMSSALVALRYSGEEDC